MAHSMSQSDQKVMMSAFEGDLVSLSSLAAFELDDFLADHASTFEAVRELAKKISSEIPIQELEESSEHDPKELVSSTDPITTIVMNRAMLDSNIGVDMLTVLDVIRQSGNIVKKLNEIVNNARVQDRANIESMKMFCLALSRTARGYEPSPFDYSPQHPFRR